MDRRRFLKYAGSAALVIGGLGLGLYESQNWGAPSSTFPSWSTTSASSTLAPPAATTTSLRTCEVELILFADYHGDGKQQPDEPDIKGAIIEVKDGDSKQVVEPDSDGKYRPKRLVEGRRYLINFASEFLDEQGWRFISLSSDAIRPVTGGFEFRADPALARISLGLMQGFLTLPLVPDTPCRVGRYYDWDPRVGRVEWWNEKTYNWTNAEGKGADDNHTGTDFDAREGEQVVAPAPGTVLSAGVGPSPESLVIDMQHDLGFKTSYNHLSKILVSVGQRISRGQAIGLVGATGTFYPHLHFELYQPWSQGPAIFDPYRPTFTVTEDRGGCWALKGREKYWLKLPPDNNPNLLNFWTKDNDPQYAIPG